MTNHQGSYDPFDLEPPLAKAVQAVRAEAVSDDVVAQVINRARRLGAAVSSGSSAANELQTPVREFERMPVPPGPSARAMVDRLRKRAPVSWNRVIKQGRELMRRPMPRFIAAMAACLAVFAVWSLAPEQHSTAHAFDAFAKAIVDAQSATFEMTMRGEGMPEQKGHCYYLAPGKLRTELKWVPTQDVQNMLRIKEFETVRITDKKTDTSITLTPEQKTAAITNIKNRPARWRPDDTAVFEQMRELLSKRGDAKESEFKELGEKEIDGHRVLGFRRTCPEGSLTLWGDPATGFPVLVEEKMTDIISMDVTMSHFKLNEDLNPALFDMTPPEGYTVQTKDIDFSLPTEQSFIVALGLSARLNDGQFFDNLDLESVQALVKKRFIPQPERGSPPLPDWVKTIIRGMQFAWGLPESTDAHYCGKGATLDQPDRPIFWYMPQGTEKYRVIFATMKVRTASSAPNVAGAVRVEKPKRRNLNDVMAEISKPVDLSDVVLPGTSEDRMAVGRLKAIAAAMRAMSDDGNRFPGNIRDKTDNDGKPLLSWRVALLPYLKQEKLYNEFRLDEPWDSKHNKKLLKKMPVCYMMFRKGTKFELGHTVILAPAGKGTAFDGRDGTSLKQITDKPSETIVLVEANAQHAVPWTKPEDLEIDRRDPAAGLLRTDPVKNPLLDPKSPGADMSDKNQYFVVARADGSAELLPANIEAAILWGFFTRAGGEKTEWPKRPKIEWTPSGVK